MGLETGCCTSSLCPSQYFLFLQGDRHSPPTLDECHHPADRQANRYCLFTYNYPTGLHNFHRKVTFGLLLQASYFVSPTTRKCRTQPFRRNFGNKLVLSLIFYSEYFNYMDNSISKFNPLSGNAPYFIILLQTILLVKGRVLPHKLNISLFLLLNNTQTQDCQNENNQGFFRVTVLARTNKKTHGQNCNFVVLERIQSIKFIY